MTENVTPTHDQQHSVKETDIAHLAGVFDAVGNISIRISKCETNRLNYRLRPIIEIARPNENDPVLGKFMEYCEEHGVKYKLKEKKIYDDEDNTHFKLSIRDANDIKSFLEPLQPFLVTRYFDAELMITEVVPAIQNDEHLNKNGFYKLVVAAEQLRANSSKNVSSKYTREFFAEKWSVPQ